jgi:hypothetical protein
MHPFRRATDVVNAASFHPFSPLAATATGDRKYAVQMKNFSDDGDDYDAGPTDKGKEKVNAEQTREDKESERQTQQQNVLALWCQLARPTPGVL